MGRNGQAVVPLPHSVLRESLILVCVNVAQDPEGSAAGNCPLTTLLTTGSLQGRFEHVATAVHPRHLRLPARSRNSSSMASVGFAS